MKKVDFCMKKKVFTVLISGDYFRESLAFFRDRFKSLGKRWDFPTKKWEVDIQIGIDKAVAGLYYDIERKTNSKLEVTEIASEMIHSIRGEWKLRQKMSESLNSEKKHEVLFPFQVNGLEYIKRTGGRCLLADPMGLGKTIQFIFYMNHLGEKSIPCLLVCPASLKYNWEKEINKWSEEEREIFIVNKGADIIPPETEVVILNYELIWKEEIFRQLSQMPFKLVGMDEAHKIKGYKSARSKAVHNLVHEECNIPYRIAMTGTPLPNGDPGELIQILRTLDTLKHFGGLNSYLQEYCGVLFTPAQYQNGEKVSQAKYVSTNQAPTKERLLQLQDSLRAICMRRTDKIAALPQLPRKNVDVIPVEITTREEYNKAVDDLKAYLKEKYAQILIEEGIDPLSASLEARRRAARSMLAENMVRIENLKQISARGKLQFLKEFVQPIREDGEKICIFAHHIDVQKELLKIQKGCCRILGSDNDRKRFENVERFQNGTETEDSVLVGSILAGGVGHTLTASRYMVIAEMTWTPADLEQLEDRVWRISQDRPVQIYYLIGKDTVDEMIYQYVSGKKARSALALDENPKDIEGEAKLDVINSLLE